MMLCKICKNKYNFYDHCSHQTIDNKIESCSGFKMKEGLIYNIYQDRVETWKGMCTGECIDKSNNLYIFLNLKTHEEETVDINNEIEKNNILFKVF